MSDSRLAPSPCRPTALAFSAPGRTATQTFRDYVLTRKYDFGRGTVSAWTFIAFARGDATFPDPQCWRDLQAHLITKGVDPHLIAGARTVWRSFKALQSRSRHGWMC